MLRPVWVHAFLSSRSVHSMESALFPAHTEATGTDGEESSSEADRLPTDIDPETLRKYFTLTEADLAQVHQCRGILNKLGFAVLLCTLRWRGSFLRPMQDLPQPVLETVATQVGVLPIPLDGYPQHEHTRYEHCERIRQYLQFVRCDATQRDRLFDHLVAMAPGRGNTRLAGGTFPMLDQGGTRTLLGQDIAEPSVARSLGVGTYNPLGCRTLGGASPFLARRVGGSSRPDSLDDIHVTPLRSRHSSFV